MRDTVSKVPWDDSRHFEPLSQCILVSILRFHIIFFGMGVTHLTGVANETDSEE